MKFDNTVYTFLKELCSFHYKISRVDLIWDLIFPDSKGKWNHVTITKYMQTFYINHMNGHSCSLEVVPKEKVSVMKSFSVSSYEDSSENPARVWGHLIQSAFTWLNTVKKDWIKANRLVQEQYPLHYRLGIFSINISSLTGLKTSLHNKHV